MSACLAWMRRNGDWAGCFVLVGLVLRLFHYGRNPAMWHDEAALVLNVLDKSFTQLLGPLEFAEAAPPLFLWVEKLVVVFLGDSTYALRLLPFLASCLALLLMFWLCRQVLRAAAVPWAMVLFACSDHLLWHACEAKPYSLDVLAAVLLACLFWAGGRWSLIPALIGQMLLAPLLIFLCYPACFLYGGVLVAFLPSVWRSRRVSVWLAYGSFAVAVIVACGLLAAGPVRVQRHEMMDQCWVDAFPPLHRPWAVVPWLVMSTLDIVRFCCEPAGNALIGLIVIGSVSFWRNGRRSLLALLLLPIVLALVASFLHAYPYAGARVLVYATPAVVLLLAEGVPPAWDWLRARLRPGLIVLLILLLAPVGQVAVRLIAEGGRADCASAAKFVMAYRRPSEVVVSQAWEARYYFRNLGSDYQIWEELRVDYLDRFWLVVVAGTAEDRYRIVAGFLAADWHIARQNEFTRTSVYLLERPAGPLAARTTPAYP